MIDWQLKHQKTQGSAILLFVRARVKLEFYPCEDRRAEVPNHRDRSRYLDLKKVLLSSKGRLPQVNEYNNTLTMLVQGIWICTLVQEYAISNHFSDCVWSTSARGAKLPIYWRGFYKYSVQLTQSIYWTLPLHNASFYFYNVYFIIFFFLLFT